MQFILRKTFGQPEYLLDELLLHDRSPAIVGQEYFVLAGDPETVRAGLEEYKAAGVDEVAMNVLGTGESLEATWELAASLGGEI